MTQASPTPNPTRYTIVLQDVQRVASACGRRTTPFPPVAPPGRVRFVPSGPWAPALGGRFISPRNMM